MRGKESGSQTTSFDNPKKIHIYDTTLRDGNQAEGVSPSAKQKIEIAQAIDGLGFIDFIELGFAESNETDRKAFEMAQDTDFSAKISAFGSTRRVGVCVEDDPGIRALLEAGTPVVTLVGKTPPVQIRQVLRTTPEEGLDMIRESIAYLKAHGRNVVYDAEHFFDTFRNRLKPQMEDPEYAIQTLIAAAQGGVDAITLCDTNGGTFYPDIYNAVKAVVDNEAIHEAYRKAHGLQEGKLRVGIHTHNDRGISSANTLEGIRAGATQIQGTINGYGERPGNSNLLTDIGNLVDYPFIPDGNYVDINEDQLRRIKPVAHRVAKILEKEVDQHMPFVGDYSHGHKAGQHINAINVNPEFYEFQPPERYGNQRHEFVSNQIGRKATERKLKQYGFPADDPRIISDLTALVKANYEKGFRYENAEGSWELLARRMFPDYTAPFELEFDGNAERGSISQAILNNGETGIILNPETHDVNALFGILCKELLPSYPFLDELQIRKQSISSENSSMYRVTLHLSDGENSWTVMGANPNRTNAGWFAVRDAFEAAIIKHIESQRKTT